ncbi:MAG: selenium cofactor biosynthesis protein YqeC [Treponema phagedenis]|nr:selenium cofactor biosynthesis protein YqeC [Treponema phagedenis]CEM61159.1 putative selenium-dependent hydroxylase accessory protein YqeC [Treponema phagedenis]
MELYKKFNIHKKDIVSITGSGGKTTLLFTLARELKMHGKVLLTSSTKLSADVKPDKNEFLFTDLKTYHKQKNDIKKNSLVILSSSIKNKKLYGINDNDLESIKEDFDYILIEADGSKQLPLKAWKENEPVILNGTTKTIGVIPIDIYDKEITESNIYESDAFKNEFNFKGSMTKEIYKNIIASPYGIFKNFKGKKYLYFTKMDCVKEKNEVNKIQSVIKEFEDEFENIKFILGRLVFDVLNANEISAIILASGFSKRFGDNKLKVNLHGKKLYEYVLDLVSKFDFKDKILITNDEDIRNYGQKRGIVVKENPTAFLGKSESIKSGLTNLNSKGYMFFVSDQPFISETTVKKLLREFNLNPHVIVHPVYGKKRGGPMIFPNKYKNDLLNLTADEGGVKLIKEDNHKAVLIKNKREAIDIDDENDYREALNG